MKLCPECRQPPAYTSFCTRCAGLFMQATERKQKADAKLAHGAAKLAERLARSADRRRGWQLIRQQADSRIIAAHRISGSGEEMAAHLGLALSTVHYHRQRLGLSAWGQPFRPSNIKPDPELAQAIADGLTAREAAARLGRTYNAVHHARQRAGLPPFALPKIKRPKHRLADQVAALRAGGHTLREIAAKLRVTRNTVGGIISRHIPRPQNGVPDELTLPHLRAPGRPVGTEGLPAGELRVAAGSHRQADPAASGHPAYDRGEVAAGRHP